MNLAHLEKLSRTRLDDVLVEEGAIDRQRVEEAQAEQERTGRQLGEILVERDVLPDYDLAKLVVTHYSLPYLDLTGYTTRREVMALLPDDYCVRHGVLPLDQFGDVLTLGVCEMPTMELIEDIVTRTKLAPFLFVVVRRALLEALDQGGKRGAKTPAKRATKIVAAPAAAAKPEPAPPAPSPADEESDLPLPDLVLPHVSMALVGGVPGAAKAPPPPPARPGSRSSIIARSPAAPVPALAAAAATSGGLNWTEAAAAKPPTRPAVTKFKFAGSGAPASTAAPADPAAKPANNGAWQSIFDTGENAVKRETTGGGKLPRQTTAKP